MKEQKPIPRELLDKYQNVEEHELNKLINAYSDTIYEEQFKDHVRAMRYILKQMNAHKRK